MLAKEEFANRYKLGTRRSACTSSLYRCWQGTTRGGALRLELAVPTKFNVAMGAICKRHFGQRRQFGALLPILRGLMGWQR